MSHLAARCGAGIFSVFELPRVFGRLVGIASAFRSLHQRLPFVKQRAHGLPHERVKVLKVGKFLFGSVGFKFEFERSIAVFRGQPSIAIVWLGPMLAVRHFPKIFEFGRRQQLAVELQL